MGGSKRATAYGNQLGADVVICYKQRKKANVIGKMTVIGDVKAGRNVILLDDMVDTAGTLTKAADMLMEQGAKSVREPTARMVCCQGHAIRAPQQQSAMHRTWSSPTPFPRSDACMKKSASSAWPTSLLRSDAQTVNSNESISGHFLNVNSENSNPHAIRQRLKEPFAPTSASKYAKAARAAGDMYPA